MNRIDIVVDDEKRLSFSATLNLESFEELQVSLATILEEAVPSVPPNPDSERVSDCLHRLVSRWFRFVLTNDTELANSMLKDKSINLNKVDVDFGGYLKSDKFVILLNSGHSFFIWMTKQIYKFLRFIFPVRFDSYCNQEPSLFLNFLGNVPISVYRAFKFGDSFGIGWIHNGFLSANVNEQTADEIGLSASSCCGSDSQADTGSSPELYPIRCLRDIELWLSKSFGESERVVENFVWHQTNFPKRRQVFLTNLSDALERNLEAQEILGAYGDQYLPLEQYRKLRSIPPQTHQCISVR